MECLGLLDLFRVSAGDPDERVRLIQDPQLAAKDLIDFVLTDELGDIALSMTDNSDVLEFFAGADVVFLRQIVAFNARTPGPIVERLAEDPEPSVRANAAYGPALSTETRARLARHDAVPVVREQAWAAMSTAQGRTIVEGARKAQFEDEVVWLVVLPG